jgi:hypothetical protein
MAPLHEAVLLGSLESVKNWIHRSEKNERNFLGQTPVHFAVSKPRYLLALVNAGHDVDAADNHGFTPLMYAAAANHEESLIVLLGGADMSLLGGSVKMSSLHERSPCNFMEYAAIRGHWNLIFKSLCWVEAVEGKDKVEGWAQLATILYHVTRPYLWWVEEGGGREVSFQKLLAKCGSADFTFDKDSIRDNNLMQFVRSVKDIEDLLERGFTTINHVDSNGQHALISAAIHDENSDVLHRLVDIGAEINLTDGFHRTALHYVLRIMRAGYGDSVRKSVNSSRMLLANGADVLCRDGCRCPCSPNGCLPSAVDCFGVYGDYRHSCVLLWSLEWLSLVLEHRGTSEAKIILLSFIRKAKFDGMGMTHVCCGHDGNCLATEELPLQKLLVLDEDIDEILDEEAEFIEILENEMALSSAKAYETLLDDWMLEFEGSLEKSREKAIEDNVSVGSNDTNQVLPHGITASMNVRSD